MKKISILLVSLILLVKVNGCTGYKPIFGSTNLEFIIADYSISGDKKIGTQIYNKLNNLSRPIKNTAGVKNIYLIINASKDKTATAKDSAGKILGYKINLSTVITIKDMITGDEILSDNFSFSEVYKAQDQFSETVKLENQNIQNLIDRTYQDLLIKLSEKLL
mgnify:FL=1|tara:strand:+ start:67 stop:555 length:489 start_codon:yes stop_codon:yes gene_type:complete